MRVEECANRGIFCKKMSANGFLKKQDKKRGKIVIIKSKNIHYFVGFIYFTHYNGVERILSTLKLPS